MDAPEHRTECGDAGDEVGHIVVGEFCGHAEDTAEDGAGAGSADLKVRGRWERGSGRDDLEMKCVVIEKEYIS